MNLAIELGLSSWARKNHVSQQFFALLGQKIKNIFSTRGTLKIGFGNGRITNVMASDGRILSEVTSSLRCIVQ